MILTRPRLAALGVTCLVVLTGCGGGGSGSAAGGSSASESFAGGGRDAAGTAGNTAAKALPVAQAAKPAVEVQQQAIIRTGTISVRTADPQQARDRVDLLLSRLRGSVDDERTVYDKSGRIRDSHLVLRVPVDSFGTAMSDLEQLGTVLHSSSTGQDVTTEVIDVEQRLRTLRISLHDLNAFQRRAATIDQLLRFENAITQRRGEYQSLKAQRDHLANQTSMSTINLDIAVPPTQAATTGHHHRAGFVTGLRHGWAALTGTLQVALTALGAALPFALLIGLVGLPLWWWLRRRGLSRENAGEITA
ncbi:MAG: DUF4349 domain-containing protein [Nocardioides sp.]